MTSKEDILVELEKQFSRAKEELGFTSNLDELDSEFAISDLVLEKGYVSSDFSNQLRVRIIDVLINWDNYLHSLVMPNPQNLFNLNEAKAFNEKDKKEIVKMMSRVAHFVSRNGLVRLTRNKEEEAKIIDDALKFWKEIYQPFFVKIMEKVEDHWKEVESGKEEIES
tara:strand:- start:200 stop:700 length:501 start_codon:yes stop_codon:yes gene_type:complete